MPAKHTRILAIDPGTREMGIAVLEKGHLLYHGVEVFNPTRSPHERLKNARRVVLRMIGDFRPQVVVVEATFFAGNRSSALLNVLADEIRSIAKRKGLRLLRLAPSTVKKSICGNGRATKAEVAQAVVAVFPSLRAYVTSDRKWKERFHANMFDAVALGLTALRRIPFET